MSILVSALPLFIQRARTTLELEMIYAVIATRILKWNGMKAEVSEEEARVDYKVILPTAIIATLTHF